MIFNYIGYIICVALIVLSVVFFATGIFDGIKNLYSAEVKSYEKALMIVKIRTFLSLICLFASSFIFVTIESGFYWENLFSLLCLLFGISFLMGIDYAINRQTYDYLKKRHISSKED